MRMRSLLVGLGTLAILLVVLGWLDRPGTVDASRDPPTPQRLSVTVDNGRTQTREGQEVTYTTRVRNDEPRDYRLEITQMLPSALRLVSSSGDAREGAGEVAWSLTVPAGQERVVRATTEVGAGHQHYARLVTTSCLALPGEPPVTCARDSDPLTATSTAAPSIGRLLLVTGLGSVLAMGSFAAYVTGGGPSSPGAVGATGPAAGPGGRADGAGRRSRAGRAAGSLRAWTARVLTALASRAARTRLRRSPVRGLARIRDQVRFHVASIRWGQARGPPPGRAPLLVPCCLQA